MSRLTEKQELFCHFIVQGESQSDAYRKAYKASSMSDNTIHVKASELAHDGKVSVRIGELKQERLERLNFDSDKVLSHLSEIIYADIADIVDEKSAFIPITEWPKIWRQMLNFLDIKEIKAAHNSEVTAQSIKARFIDRMKALELVGKHIDVGAYQEKIKTDTSDNLAKRLEAARRRMNLAHQEKPSY